MISVSQHSDAACFRTSSFLTRVPPSAPVAGVHEIYDIVEGPDWAAGEQRASKLVFIGRRLRRDALAADLAACQAEQ